MSKGSVGILTLIISFFALATAFAGSDDDQIYVRSIISLIATPSIYDQKSVVVYGVIDGDASGWAIYLSTEDAARSIFVNGIWLETNDVSPKTLDSVNGKWATVRGKFDKDNGGHLGMFPGAIRNIDRIVAVPDPIE